MQLYGIVANSVELMNSINYLINFPTQCILAPIIIY